MLQGVTDRYKGVTVTVPSDMSLSDFTVALDASLASWRSNGMRGIWITVGESQLSHAQVLIDRGFTMHHVREEDNNNNNNDNNNEKSSLRCRVLCLTQWLDLTCPNQLPHHSTHLVGVGCVVFHPDGKRVLMVQEMFESGAGRWKLPGGLVDQGELLTHACKREVMEETGVSDIHFRWGGCPLLFRERTDALFHQSDLYFVLVADATHDHIVRCEREITQCEWKLPEDVCDDINVWPPNRAIFKMASELVKKGSDWTPHSMAWQHASLWSGKTHVLYAPSSLETIATDYWINPSNKAAQETLAKKQKKE